MKKIMFNQDWQEFFHRRFDAGIDVTEQVLRDFIFQYRDTQITDFAMNVNAQIASFPSEVMESFADKYLQKQENGMAVDYTHTPAATMYDIFIRKGLDMFAIWIDALRQCGIRPWASVRMNDCHHNYLPAHLFISRRFRENPQLRRVRHRTPDPSVQRKNEDAFYFDACHDYALPQVRAFMLSFIREVLERYDVDGLELDFTRELPAFQIGMEAAGRGIMTEFVGQIREETRKAAQRRGHEIRLNVLVGADPQVVFCWGYDVEQWAQLGLVDSVVALPRWETAYAETPVQLWKKLLRGTAVEFAAGNQILIKEVPFGPQRAATLETTLGMVAAYRSLGADFTYLYNYMDMAECAYSDIEPWYADETLNQPVIRPENLRKVFCTAGDTAMAVRSRRRHPVTFYDFPNSWDKICTKLPFLCSDRRYFELVRIVTGQIPPDARVQLLVGTESETPICREDISLSVNSQGVKFHSVYYKNAEKTKAGWLFDVEAGGICEFAVAELTTATDKPFWAVHMEILVTPQEEL